MVVYANSAGTQRKLSRTTFYASATDPMILWESTLIPLQRTHSHKLVQYFVGNLSAALLVGLDKLLKLHDALLLQFSRQQLSLCISHSNLFELVIVIREETQILEGYVDLRVAT